MEVSAHAFNRIDTRVMPIRTMREANKIAREAYANGYSIEQLDGNYNNLANYLRFKLSTNSPRTEVRLYKDCVWLWNGRQKVLRTVYPIEKSIPCLKDLKRLKKEGL